MKIFLFICIMLLVLNANAQSVDRNDIVIAASPGASLNAYSHPDTGRLMPRQEYLALRIPVSLEYVFNQRSGLSLDIVYTRLYPGMDYTSDYTINDVGLGYRFHSLSEQRILHWFGSIGVHYSKLKFELQTDFYSETKKANGIGIFFDLGTNIDLTSNGNFGIGFSLNGSGYNYLSGQHSDSSGDIYNFKMQGICLSTGINLFYKI